MEIVVTSNKLKNNSHLLLSYRTRECFKKTRGFGNFSDVLKQFHGSIVIYCFSYLHNDLELMCIEHRFYIHAVIKYDFKPIRDCVKNLSYTIAFFIIWQTGQQSKEHSEWSSQSGPIFAFSRANRVEIIVETLYN